MDRPQTAKAYLIGAGPGDPGLVTVKGLAIIESADVVLYDHLAPLSLLDRARPDAERIYVGKKRAAHHRTQDEINRLLIEHVSAGRVVARLKGGDPFIFGRGGEEAEALAEAGVPFEVVPGVSSATGAAAYAGIPLTHRDKTSAVTFITGHEVERIDWSRLGLTETLVVFMGLTTFARIAQELIAAGRDPHTPAAAVRWGTRADQQTVDGTLGTLAARIQEAALKPPALVIIGEVVALRERIDWFEKLPLFGRRIAITRAADQASGLAESLRALGADPVLLPTIEIGAPQSYEAIDDAIARLETYDWLIFTSRNGVERFVERLDSGPRDLRALRAKIAAIGPATAEAVRALHLKVDLIPEQYVAESVIEAFDQESIEGKHVLIARAERARDVLPDALARRGAQVHVAPAYRTTTPADAAARIEQAQVKPLDWITFTSSSTVDNFVKLAGLEPLRATRIASIGPITSETIRGHGLSVAAEADPYTVEGLLSALLSHTASGA